MCSCCECTCTPEENGYDDESGYNGCIEFACIDPAAECVDDDDITVDMFEECGYVSRVDVGKRRHWRLKFLTVGMRRPCSCYVQPQCLHNGNGQDRRCADRSSSF